MNQVTRQKVELPPVDLRDKIFSFLVSYRDADSCDTRKFGGRVLPYMQSKYLLRSYKNAHLTVIQLRKTSDPVNQLAKDQESQRVFQWNKIYLSGLYYRINQYEKQHGSIENDMSMLNEFFTCNQKKEVQKEISFARKYKEYQAFMNAKEKINV